jgi:hypothetical protein
MKVSFVHQGFSPFPFSPIFRLHLLQPQTPAMYSMELIRNEIQAHGLVLVFRKSHGIDIISRRYNLLREPSHGIIRNEIKGHSRELNQYFLFVKILSHTAMNSCRAVQGDRLLRDCIWNTMSGTKRSPQWYTKTSEENFDRYSTPNLHAVDILLNSHRLCEKHQIDHKACYCLLKWHQSLLKILIVSHNRRLLQLRYAALSCFSNQKTSRDLATAFYECMKAIFPPAMLSQSASSDHTTTAWYNTNEFAGSLISKF